MSLTTQLAEQTLRSLATQALRADGAGEQEASERVRALFKALRPSLSEAVERVPLAPNVDGQDFYELCQAYRHAKEMMPYGMPNVSQAFNNLREYIKTGKLPWPSYERPSAPSSEE